MFFELARILRAKQPRLFVFENVKGLLSHDGGKSFATIIQTLDELGYDCQWQVLNSKNHGVPQNRERVFIVGHLRGTPRPKVFPFGSSNETPNGDAEIRQLNQPRHSNDRVYGAEGISPTLNTMQGGNRQPFIVGGLQGHQIAKDDGIAPCLTTAMGQGGGQTPIVWSDDIKIRRLTPTECERLQGFPDGWTEGVSDTQRYKTLGNAVTVNVIRDIMEKLLSTPKEQI
jgi:DNA (cytosine-5)-methyltransferase 1